MGTPGTHRRYSEYRIRYSEYFHAVLRVPAWGTSDARMHTLLLCCVRASGMPLGTVSDPAWRCASSLPVTRNTTHPGVGSTTWCPAWGTRSVHMGLTLAHPAHSRSALAHACEEGACACTRAHQCALRAATILQRRITCAALSSFRLRICRREV